MFLVILASLIDPRNFYRAAAERLETSKHNLHQWAALFSQPAAPSVSEQASVSEPPIAERPAVIANEPPNPRRVLIRRGFTVTQIASEVYGAVSYLALDLIKEFNPRIANLNAVFPGQEILLPPLTHETMLRQQPDGSYQLIAASFPSLTEASDYAELLSDAGYRVVIKPHRIADNLLLQRVAIADLRSFEEVD